MLCAAHPAKTHTGTQAVNHDVNLKVKRRDTGIALFSGLCRSRRLGSRLGGNRDGSLELGEAQAASEAFVAVSRCRRERRGGQRTTPAGEFDGQKAICACGKLCTEPRFWNLPLLLLLTTEMLGLGRLGVYGLVWVVCR